MNTINSEADLEQMRQNAAKAEQQLKMLANSNRLLILCSLLKGEKSVGELNQQIALSQSALSQHLAKLRFLGVVEARKDGQQVFYRIISKEVESILQTLYIIYCQDTS